MSLKTEIIPYIDGNGLVAPGPANPKIRSSDNGVMFTSEYYIMLNRNKELTSGDQYIYSTLINNCIGADGHLHRAPNDESPDEIDDHLGVLAGYAEIRYSVPFHLPLNLCRFPQLVYAHMLNRGVPSLLIFPLAIINAFIIALSGFNTPANNADVRRLNWLLLQATKRKSLLARFAGWLWHKRQAKLYGSEQVMKAVAQYYYSPGHPFREYWID